MFWLGAGEYHQRHGDVPIQRVVSRLDVCHVSWSPSSAVLTAVLVDPKGVVVPTTTTGSNPTTVTGQAAMTGTYKVRVKAKSGNADFSGTVTFPGVSVPSYAGQIGGGSSGHATMYPSGLDVGPDGTVYVADTGNDQVAAYSPAGVQLWRIGARGKKGIGTFDNPRDVTFLNGNLYVDDTGDNRVEVIDTTANLVTARVTAWPTRLPPRSASRREGLTGHDIILAARTRPARSRVRPIGGFGATSPGLQERCARAARCGHQRGWVTCMWRLREGSIVEFGAVVERPARRR